MAHICPTDINTCSVDSDWERLQEIRDSIVTRAPIYVTPSLVAQSKPQAQSQPAPQPPSSQPQLRSQPLQSSYYHPARSQTPPQYAMASYNSTGYAPPSGLRAARNPQPQPVPFQIPPAGAASQLRPIAGLMPPIISYKPSPFYESKYQIGDPRSLEGECRIVLPSPRCSSLANPG